MTTKTQKTKTEKPSIDLTTQATEFVSKVSKGLQDLKQSIKSVYKVMIDKQVKHNTGKTVKAATDKEVNTAKRQVNKIVYAVGDSKGLNKDTLRVYCSLCADSLGLAKDVVNAGNSKKRKAKDNTKTENVQGVITIDTRVEEYTEEMENGIASLLSMFTPSAHMDDIIESFNKAIQKTKFKNRLELRKIA